jgi:hypothetical protein
MHDLVIGLFINRYAFGRSNGINSSETPSKLLPAVRAHRSLQGWPLVGENTLGENGHKFLDIRAQAA